MHTIEFYEQNIRKYYDRATEEQLLDGIDWYSRANRFARRVSKRYTVSFDTVCRVIAVLSPMMSWDRNKRMAEIVIAAWLEDSRDVTGYVIKKNLEKAFGILDGKPECLKGEKVERFYHNIRHSETSTEVTVDTHAYRVAIDDPNTPYKTSAGVANSKAGAMIREAYTNVAQELGLLPHQLQAIVWLVLREGRRIN